MSLVAIVYCRCVEQGKASAPPFSPELLVSDEEGRLTLNLPEGHEKQTLKEQKHQWEKSCCTHLWRHYLNEWVCDWHSVQILRNALVDLEANNFPTLSTCLPFANTGTVSPEESKQALLELDIFEQYLQRGTYRLAALVSDNGHELCSNGYHQGRCIYLTDTYEFWVDGSGLKILSHASDKPVFESRHFLQGYLDSSQKTRFTDKETAVTFIGEGDLRLHDAQHSEQMPLELKVEERTCSADGFDFIIQPLRKAFQASAEISRPLIWG